MRVVKVKKEVYYTVELTADEVELLFRLLAEVRQAMPTASSGVFVEAERLRKELLDMNSAAYKAS